jgi:hypothetical protein
MARTMPTTPTSPCQAPDFWPIDAFNAAFFVTEDR